MPVPTHVVSGEIRMFSHVKIVIEAPINVAFVSYSYFKRLENASHFSISFAEEFTKLRISTEMFLHGRYCCLDDVLWTVRQIL